MGRCLYFIHPKGPGFDFSEISNLYGLDIDIKSKEVHEIRGVAKRKVHNGVEAKIVDLIIVKNQDRFGLFLKS